MLGVAGGGDLFCPLKGQCRRAVVVLARPVGSSGSSGLCSGPDSFASVTPWGPPALTHSAACALGSERCTVVFRLQGPRAP